MTYKFYSDSGHGWLKVPIKDIYDLRLEDKISLYSYRKGNHVYLEEDRDCPIFLEACKLSGKVCKIQEMKPSHRSRIRNYNHYYQ